MRAVKRPKMLAVRVTTPHLNHHSGGQAVAVEVSALGGDLLETHSGNLWGGGAWGEGSHGRRGNRKAHTHREQGPRAEGGGEKNKTTTRGHMRGRWQQ